MVFLNRIYTRSGDTGETSLGSGARVPKTDPRIAAYGGVDELNAVLGVALATGVPQALSGWLRQIQNDLFDVGADLCVPESPAPPDRAPLRLIAAQAARLEQWIDALNDRLAPLTSFILPGGTTAAAHLHHARTVCRRVECNVWRLAVEEIVNEQVLIYLNRLSDLLFVMARVCNDEGRDDILWQPGRGRQDDT